MSVKLSRPNHDRCSPPTCELRGADACAQPRPTLPPGGIRAIYGTNTCVHR